MTVETFITYFSKQLLLVYWIQYCNIKHICHTYTKDISTDIRIKKIMYVSTVLSHTVLEIPANATE